MSGSEIGAGRMSDGRCGDEGSDPGLMQVSVQLLGGMPG